jgi:3-deoxy-D-manno-octulosonic-acid transferase
MRAFYSALFNLLLPFIILRLVWRSIKAPDYRKRWRERFAYYSKPLQQGVIWFHAVSVGEAEALFPLIKRLHAANPQEKILVTSTTPTGSARIRAVLGDTVEHVYLPYDTPGIVKRFIRAVKPKLAVIMETEIWPNLFHYCGVANIPLFLINARLSEKSTRGYQKIPSLIRQALANIKLIAAQTLEDAGRFRAIGANPGQLTVLGNIKFDIILPPEIIAAGQKLKAEIFAGRFVWLAASTHQGEEQILLEAYRDIKKTVPELLLMIVPRHPERFRDVETLCLQQKLNVVRRSMNQPVQQGTDIYLGDTMGELKMLYTTADLAYVGGSLVPVGGHNILEALAANIPVLFGPYMANFKAIAEQVLVCGAARQCLDVQTLVGTVNDLYAQLAQRNALIESGRDVLEKNRGVLTQYYELIAKEIRTASR